MRESMLVSNGEMVKVTCILCKRIVRTVAERGVIGESGLARIGWTVNESGKPVCDECRPAPASMLTPDQQARVDRILGGGIPPAESAQAQAEAYDLETVARVEELVKATFGRHQLEDLEIQAAGFVIRALRRVVRSRTEGSK